MGVVDFLGVNMECGGCTECCTAFPVVELNKDAWTVCDYADEGCKIYNARPQSCRDCYCAWITQPVVAPGMRPDKCGVIFEKVSDTVMVGTIIGEVDPRVKGQVNAFKSQGFRVLIQKEK